MLAADTNVALRLALGDDIDQVAAVRRVLDREALFISLTVLLETGWVLESRYGYSRDRTADALTSLTLLDGVMTARRALVEWALVRYRAGADLADMVHLAAAAKHDGFITFDRGIKRLAGDNPPVSIETLA